MGCPHGTGAAQWCGAYRPTAGLQEGAWPVSVSRRRSPLWGGSGLGPSEGPQLVLWGLESRVVGSKVSRRAGHPGGQFGKVPVHRTGRGARVCRDPRGHCAPAGALGGVEVRRGLAEQTRGRGRWCSEFHPWVEGTVPLREVLLVPAGGQRALWVSSGWGRFLCSAQGTAVTGLPCP